MNVDKSVAGNPESTVVKENPFPGLRPFHKDEKHLFFGRENQIDSMVDKLSTNRFLAVIGGSGSGKSSLVNCGLRPALQDGLMSSAGTTWRMVQFRPGNDPIGEMARALASGKGLFRNYEAKAVPLTEIVDTNLRMSKLGLIDIYKQAKLNESVNLLVVVDQFEELFRYGQLGHGEEKEINAVSEEAIEFVNLLLAIREQTRYPIHVVLTMRSDFLGDCTQFPGLAEAINEGQYLVPRMTRDERRAAISGPVEVGGAKISPVLLTRLVNDVGDKPDQLSILQHALNRTWAKWEYDGGVGLLDLTHYKAIGKMAKALDQHAEKAYEELGSDRQKLICEKIFKALTDQATEPRGIRRPTTFGTLCELAEASADEVTEVIDVFRRPSRSFLIPPAGEPLQAETVVDISHESLMRVWARLNKWADEEAVSAHIYRRLTEFSVLHAKGEAGLWRDPDLQIALGWRDRNRPNEVWARQYHPGFDSAMGFLNKSKVRRRRRRFLGLGSAAVIFIALMGISIWAVNSREQAIIATKQAKDALGNLDKAKATIEQAVTDKKAADQAKSEAVKNASLTVKQAQVQANAIQKKATDAETKAKIATEKALTARKRALAEKLMADQRITKAFTVAVKANESRLEALDLAAKADEEKDLATDLRSAAEKLLYVGNIRFAQREIGLGQVGRAEDLLKPYLKKDRNKLRGIEWYLLWGLLYPEKGTLSGHSGAVTSVAFSADGKTLATGSQDSTVKLWDVATKEVETLTGHSDPVTSVAFSADGKTLVTGSQDSTVKLWDVATKEVETLTGHSDPVTSVAFSADGKTLATGSQDSTVKLWDLATKELVATLSGDSGPVTSVAFSSDGQTLATGSQDSTVKLWDLATKEVETLTGHSGPVLSVAFSADGKTLATGSDDKRDVRRGSRNPNRGTVRLWDVATKRDVATLSGHSGAVMSVAFSPDGKTLATGSVDKSDVNRGSRNPNSGTVRLWDLATKELVATLSGHSDRVLSVAFSSDGKTLATGSADNTVKLWDLATKKRTKVTLSGDSDPVTSVAFSSDEKTLATGSYDGKVKLWDLATKELVETLSGHSGPVTSVAFSADEKTLATGSQDSTVKLWDLVTKELVATLTGHSGPVLSVAFSADGKTLATGSQGSTVKLWDLATKKEVDTFSGHSGPVLSVAFSADGKTLATGSDDKRDVRRGSRNPNSGTVRLWDLATKELLATLSGHSGPVTSVAFSSDEKTLATGSYDGTVKLWDLATKELVETLSGHSGPVTSVAFSADEKTLATGSWDGTVKLWDLATKTEVVTLSGHSDPVTSVAFSSDGKTLATGSWDGTVKLWVAVTDLELAAFAARSMVSEGRELFEKGKFEDAIVLLEEALSFYPDIDLDPETEGIQNDPKAEANKFAARSMVSEGRKLFEKGKIEEAIVLLEGALSFYPDIDLDPGTEGIQNDPKAEANKFAAIVKVSEGRELAGEGKIEDAIVLLEEALRKYPDIDLDPGTEGIQNDPKAEANKFAAIVKVSEGRELAGEGKIEDAIVIFEGALRKYPDIDLDPETEGIQNDPKAEANKFAARSMVSEGRELAGEGKIEDAIVIFEGALRKYPDIDLDPETEGIQNDPKAEANKFAAFVKVWAVVELAQEGKIDQALGAIDEAKKLDSSVEIDAFIWNGLCWFGSLQGGAAEVLFACDNAVSLSPKDGSIRDSRGLARAKTGDFKGAIEDFEFAIDSDEMGAEYNEMAIEWIKALKEGKDPFTRGVLKQLMYQ